MAIARSRSVRSDSISNRGNLVSAARVVFADRGPDVALEEVAAAASVSRATLYRHFKTREALAAVVFEENVAEIERKSSELGTEPNSIVALLDFVLDMQLHDRSLAKVLAGAEITWFSDLSSRTARAFEPHLQAGLESGLVHPGLDLDDVLTAFPMASAAISDNDRAGRDLRSDRVRAMVHRALFTR